jgi:hypothetical protein
MKQILAIILVFLTLSLVHSVSIVKKFTPNETYCFSDDIRTYLFNNHLFIAQHTLMKLKTNV